MKDDAIELMQEISYRAGQQVAAFNRYEELRRITANLKSQISDLVNGFPEFGKALIECGSVSLGNGAMVMDVRQEGGGHINISLTTAPQVKHLYELEMLLEKSLESDEQI